MSGDRPLTVQTKPNQKHILVQKKESLRAVWVFYKFLAVAITTHYRQSPKKSPERKKKKLL